MCYVGSPTNWGVGIKGGTVPNGIAQTISLASTVEQVQAKVLTTSVANTPTLGVRLVFKNSSNTTVHVAEYAVATGVLDSNEFFLTTPKPPSATTVQVDASAGGAATAIGFVDRVTVESVASLDVATDDPVECDNAAEDHEMDVRTDCEDQGLEYLWTGDCEGRIVGSECEISCEGYCITPFGIDPAET